jgi:hypothetical protein
MDSVIVKLLSGHWNRYRSEDLLHRVVAIRNGGSVAARWALGMLNATLRMRRQFRIEVILRVRRFLSRAGYSLNALISPLPPPKKVRTISLLCPTRARPQNVAVFMHSVRTTAARPDRIEVLFYIDDDDPQLETYLQYFNKAEKRNRKLMRCVPIVAPPIGVSKAWTSLAEQSTGDLLFMANDDQYYVDYAWDLATERICDRYPDDIFCLYYEDRSHDEIPEEGVPRGNFPIVSRKWFDVVGHFTPGIFKFWCNEVWLLDIAQRIGRLQSIPGVYVDHLHYDAYKSPFDETYFRPQMSGTVAQHDRELFAATALDRMKAAVKLHRVIRAANRQQEQGSDPTGILPPTDIRQAKQG